MSSSQGEDFPLVDRAARAINTAKAALPYLTLGMPLISRGPEGSLHVDLPLMYNGFAVDRVHFDPLHMSLSPKGRPVRIYGSVDVSAIIKRVEDLLSGMEVLEGAEYREPENAWAVPVVWRKLIVAHIKVRDGSWSIVPDYALTEELRRRVV